MSFKNLEIKKLLMDLKYYKEELDLKKEMVNDLDMMFSEAVDDFLNENSEYKEKWNSYTDKKDDYIDELLKKEFKRKSSVKVDDIENIEVEIKKDDKNPLIKKIYRDIVKITHPDKTKSLTKPERKQREDLYKESTRHYKTNNIAELLYCANELGIYFELTDKKLLNNFKKSLKTLKEQSNFLEQTFTWKWYNSDNNRKQKIIESFIKNKTNYID
jgi:hypothetical protein